MSNEPEMGNLAAAKTKGGQPDPWEAVLAAEILELYPPVFPGPGFRQQLRDGLVERTRRRLTLRVDRPAERRRWAVIAGAALGSLMSLVGLAVYLVRSRLAGKAQHAASR